MNLGCDQKFIMVLNDLGKASKSMEHWSDWLIRFVIYSDSKTEDQEEKIMLTPALIHAVIDQHSLKGTHSIHFVDHWARVLENGRCLASQNSARLDVVELFAVFHDAGRTRDGIEPQHGKCGARIAASMRGRFFELDQIGMDLLDRACRMHTAGRTDADVTVQTCWDSDRLDLLRAGIYPAPYRLCTPAARDPKMIAWANKRALGRFVPLNIYEEWGINTV